MVSEASEAVEADAAGGADIEVRELKPRRPLTLEGLTVCVDVVDREDDDDVEGAGETGRSENEGVGVATCRGCGVFRASRACMCSIFKVDLSFSRTASGNSVSYSRNSRA